MPLLIPDAYCPALGVLDTQRAIKFIRSRFHEMLAHDFGLMRISAPLFVLPESGENDDLNGVERPVRFGVPAMGTDVEIVHSLAKWKRVALGRYGFAPGEGLFTEMNAIRRDEELDNTHSIYVDQWDWERVIAPGERNIGTLVECARRLYVLLRQLARETQAQFGEATPVLPEKLHILSQAELDALYPHLSEKAREDEICRAHGAVLLTQISENRAPDYDDWTMNGDILFHFPVLDAALEISSMGVRVDGAALRRQCESKNTTERLALPYHQHVLENKLPLTVGGGLGQSRICQFLLGKAHIGEVQASIWPADMAAACKRGNILLL